jgi:putative hydrolase of the HAD superfamily
VPGIKAVLFDFGGVVLSSPFEAFRHYERDHGLPEDFIRTVNATNHHDNAWALLERGEVDLEGFDELFREESKALGHEVPGLDVLGLLGGEVRPAMVEALRRIKARGLPLALLTNNFTPPGGVDQGHQARPEVAEAMALFDHVIESSKAGVRKPDPRAYELALGALGHPAEEVVFLDDLGINLKPAREMGMTTIKVVDGDQAIADLEAVLGFPLR